MKLFMHAYCSQPPSLHTQSVRQLLLELTSQVPAALEVVLDLAHKQNTPMSAILARTQLLAGTLGVQVGKGLSHAAMLPCSPATGCGFAASCILQWPAKR